jgi:hypothetical protein
VIYHEQMAQRILSHPFQLSSGSQIKTLTVSFQPGWVYLLLWVSRVSPCV